MSLSLPTDVVASDASLQVICSHLADQLLAGRGEPGLVRLRRVDADGFELAFKPLDGVHPSEYLLGFEAPDDWDNLGVLAAGNAYHSETRAGRGRAVMATWVSRRNEVASSARFGEHEAIDGGDPPSGHVVDLLRRALRLPTDPPPCSTTTLLAMLWLERILALCDEVEKPAWEDIADLNVGWQLAGEFIGVSGLSGRADLVAGARAIGRAIDWARLRAMVDEGRITWPRMQRGDGAWFDDGSFARWVLSDLPSLRALRNNVRARLSHQHAARLDTIFDKLEVPDATWPDQREQPKPAA